MAKDNESTECNCISHRPRRHRDGGILGGAYGVAFIGAAVYFIQHADTFWMGVYGFLKALVWPAILVYKLLEYLKI